MNREDVTIKIVIINKNNSYKKNTEDITWTLEEEAQIKYYKYNSPTKKRMTWKEIGNKLNKSPSLVKKIWHSIIEKEQKSINLSPCPLCGGIHY